MSHTHSVTRAIHAFDPNDQKSKNELFNLVYPQLKKMARNILFKFPAIETIAPDDLVAELYPRLLRRENLQFLHSREDFYRYTHRIMFNRIYDYKRGKRFNYQFDSYDEQLIQLGFEEELDKERMELLLKYIDELHEGRDDRMKRVATVASRRLFEGCSRKELAKMYNKDVKTITRDWQVFVAGWEQFKRIMEGR